MLQAGSDGRVRLKLIVRIGDFSDLQSREIITILVILVGKSRSHLSDIGMLLKSRLHVQYFPRDGMQFQEIIAMPSRGKNCTCGMSCAGNATSSEKLPKYCKLLIFWQFICQQILPSHRVAGLQFFRAMATQ